MNAKFGLGKLKGRDHLKDTGVDGKIILKWKQGRRFALEASGS